MRYKHCVEVTVGGEVLVAMPHKTLFWPATSTLFAADIHLGKAAAFRSLAVPVPAGTTEGTLNRLTHAILETNPSRIILLGDLWHSKTGRTEEVIGKFAAWRKRHEGREVILVEGNHDLKSGKLPPNLNVREVEDCLREGPFELRHHPIESDSAYVLAGHIHPCVHLEGRGKQSLTLPVFWFGARTAVLPAFGEFTGCAAIEPAKGDIAIAACQDRLYRIPI